MPDDSRIPRSEELDPTSDYDASAVEDDETEIRSWNVQEPMVEEPTDPDVSEQGVEGEEHVTRNG